MAEGQTTGINKCYYGCFHPYEFNLLLWFEHQPNRCSERNRIEKAKIGGVKISDKKEKEKEKGKTTKKRKIKKRKIKQNEKSHGKTTAERKLERNGGIKGRSRGELEMKDE